VTFSLVVGLLHVLDRVVLVHKASKKSRSNVSR